MTLLAFGLNHSTAPVDVREKVVFGADILVDALKDLRRQKDVQEAAIFSTCNRTEVYCSLDEAAQPAAVQWFQDFHLNSLFH